jgi:MOSC domain-containing protein YiiM
VDSHRNGGELMSVNLAHPIPTPAPVVHGRIDAKPAMSGIDKRPVIGPVCVRRLGLTGDAICDTDNHGGLDQAVYAYAIEDTDWWQQTLAGELRFPLGPGLLGENLTVRGMPVTDAVIGERWRIGSAMLQVSVPRTPCSTFAGFWGVDRLIERFTAAARPGAYLRVLTEGQLCAGDQVSVLDRPRHGLTVGETFRALTGERELAPKLLTAPELPADVHEHVSRWLATAR